MTKLVLPQIILLTQKMDYLIKGKASKLTVLITHENSNYHITEIGADPDINMSHLARSGQSTKIEIKISLINR